MANAQKATKALVSGSDGMYVIQPGYAFQRKANISADWKKVRVSTMFSFCGLSGVNAQTVTEEIAFNSSALYNNLVFGVTNGVGYPGISGNRFLGCEVYPAWGNKTAVQLLEAGVNTFLNTGGGYGIQYTPLRGIFGDGTTLARTVGKTNFDSRIGDIRATSSFMMGLSLELDLTVANTLTASGIVSGTLSDPSDAACVSLMEGTHSSMGSVAGGWWDSSTPVGCQYFYIRFPFLNNRLRIHNMMVLPLA